MVVGIVSAAIAHHKDRNSPFVVLTCAWATYLLVFHSLSNLPIDKLPLFLGIHMRFWMQPHLISFIYLGLGLQPLLSAASLWRSLALSPSTLESSKLRIKG